MSDRTRREFVADSARLVAAGALGLPILGALQGCADGTDAITGGSPLIRPVHPGSYRVLIRGDGFEIVDQATGESFPNGIAFQPPVEAGYSPSPGDELNLQFEFEEARPERPDTGARYDYSGQFPGFAVFIGRWDWHPLSPCLNFPVTHFHMQVARDKNAIANHKLWFNLHIGTYRNGNFKCFVVFDSEHKWICLRLCSPTLPGLRSMIYDGMMQDFRAAGVQVSSTALWIAAGVLAVATFGLLMAAA